MAKAPRTYTRLTRPTPSVGSYKSLWLAADHLLVVNSTGYSEEYQRVQLRDIKGFFVIASDRRLWWGLPWGILAAISGGAMGVTLSQRGTPIASVIFLALSLGVMTANHLLGPGCKAYIVTGVQTALLPSLVRRRKATKVLGRLQPLVEAAQADLNTAAPAPTPLGEPPRPSPPPLQ